MVSFQPLSGSGTTRLTWNDFAAIFSISNCAATYQEQLYFVPFAFAHQTGYPIDGLEYVSGFVEFFIRNTDTLERADLLVPAQSEFAALLRTWTRSFRVTHFDRAACARKGWSIEYNDLVENSQAVTELLERLLAHDSLASVSEAFVRRTASDTSTVGEAAWFLEIARAVQDCSVDFFVPGATERTSWSSERAEYRVQSLLTDSFILEHQFSRASIEAGIVEQSPTYWKDLATALGLP